MYLDNRRLAVYRDTIYFTDMTDKLLVNKHDVYTNILTIILM